ncbi:hypothetical protein TSUD_291160 [Trifolium subterraneum]|uniref:Uncharacterized protein n=1 Tax=Trifolium subterraneum TaxID=3900 RepID=A0A2Z6P7C8_TRISU|nr:hypothetical protein TSUD_291160 [Trifolium subterraneum]
MGSRECSNQKTHQGKPGWKAMPYIFENDTVERLATFGIQTNFVVYLMKTEGSILSSIAQVLVAARRKQHLHLAASENTNRAFYDPPLLNGSEGKLPITKEFR